jgi:hypothetical protein
MGWRQYSINCLAGGLAGESSSARGGGRPRRAPGAAKAWPARHRGSGERRPPPPTPTLISMVVARLQARRGTCAAPSLHAHPGRRSHPCPHPKHPPRHHAHADRRQSPHQGARPRPPGGVHRTPIHAHPLTRRPGGPAGQGPRARRGAALRRARGRPCASRVPQLGPRCRRRAGAGGGGRRQQTPRASSRPQAPSCPLILCRRPLGGRRSARQGGARRSPAGRRARPFSEGLDARSEPGPPLEPLHPTRSVLISCAAPSMRLPRAPRAAPQIQAAPCI